MKFSKFSVHFSYFLFHINPLLTLTNTIKKESARSVQPFTCDAVTKGNRDSFLCIEMYVQYCTADLMLQTYLK